MNKSKYPGMPDNIQNEHSNGSEQHVEALNQLLIEVLQQKYDEPKPPKPLYDAAAVLLGFLENAAEQSKPIE